MSEGNDMGNEDENDETQPHAHFIPANQLPQGLRNMLGMHTPEEQAAADRSQMSAEADAIRLQEMLATATEDDLKMYRLMVSFALADTSMGYKLVGTINGLLGFRFGHCMGCGQKHNDPSQLLE